MKTNLTHLGAGIVLLILAVLTMKFITLNLSWVTLLISVYLFAYSYVLISKSQNKIVHFALVALPICIAFYFLILPELPSLWLGIVFFIVSGIIGWLSAKTKLVLATLILIPLFSFFVIPQLVEKNLAKHLNIPAPKIELQRLDNSEVTNLNDFQNKIVIMDFYGTWCKPCIQEIQELKELKSQYENRDDIEFLLVCTSFASDTPAKAKAFMEKYQLSFKSYFDTNNTTHKELEFTGVPALVIFDKNGMVRFKHEGYNPSENFVKSLTDVINSLL